MWVTSEHVNCTIINKSYSLSMVFTVFMTQSCIITCLYLLPTLSMLVVESSSSKESAFIATLTCCSLLWIIISKNPLMIFSIDQKINEALSYHHPNPWFIIMPELIPWMRLNRLNISNLLILPSRFVSHWLTATQISW